MKCEGIIHRNTAEDWRHSSAAPAASVRVPSFVRAFFINGRITWVIGIKSFCFINCGFWVVFGISFSWRAGGETSGPMVPTVSLDYFLVLDSGLMRPALEWLCLSGLFIIVTWFLSPRAHVASRSKCCFSNKTWYQVEVQTNTKSSQLYKSIQSFRCDGFSKIWWECGLSLHIVW